MQRLSRLINVSGSDGKSGKTPGKDGRGRSEEIDACYLTDAHAVRLKHLKQDFIWQSATAPI